MEKNNNKINILYIHIILLLYILYIICIYYNIIYCANFSFVQSYYSYAIKKYNIIFNNKINHRIEKS